MVEELTTKQIEILEKNNTIDAQPEDVQAMIQIFNDQPEIWQLIGNMVQQNIDHILSIENSWPPLATEITRRGLASKQKELGYETSPMLEKMVIDAVLLAWVRWQDVEYKYTVVNRGEGITLFKTAFWEKRLSATQGRFLRACESLARIRRLAPTLQINIATENGQQVNIAGGFVRQAPIVEKGS